MKISSEIRNYTKNGGILDIIETDSNKFELYRTIQQQKYYIN